MVPLFKNLNEALDQKPDVAFICNPTHLHMETALQCARGNCNLFIEKPVSNSLNAMDELISILSKNKKIAIFSAPDGGAYKYEENQAITDSTTIVDIYTDVVIVQDGENNLFEVYMNNIIKPSEG